MIFLSILLVFTTSHAEIYNVDDSVPWISINRRRLTLSSGWDSLIIFRGACVRVNARGMHVKAPYWSQSITGDVWDVKECMPGLVESICQTEQGLVFPISAVPVYDAQLADASKGKECSRAEDGRVFSTGYGYDISTCDVLDSGGDVALCGRKLYVRSEEHTV